jgi:hypothetical protein
VKKELCGINKFGGIGSGQTMDLFGSVTVVHLFSLQLKYENETLGWS